MTELSLAQAFPTAKDSDWQALVAAALKGAPLASLRSETYDRIAIEPLYPRATAAKIIPGRVPGEPWGVVQRADLPDTKAANGQILEDLSNGANGLSLVFPGAVGDYGYALTPTPEALAETLAGVQFDAGIAIELNLGPNCKETALMLTNLVQMQGIPAASVNIRFGFDPLGLLAANGWNTMPWPAMEPIFAALIADLKSQGFQGPFAAGDGRPVHAAGGSEAQELAFALSTALAYLRAMEAGGISLDDARSHIFFRLAADQDQFLTIAKFRALRKLWARIEEACGLTPRPAFVAAETAWRMMTRRDPHGNIVRGTIAALAATLGGADAVSVLPYSAALGAPAAHARRIARNTQTILIEESNLHRVADPAAGSGAIGALTDAVCTKAWALFQDIERAGAEKALTLIGDAVAKTCKERQRNAARRQDVMVGTSDFPDLGEDGVAVVDTMQGPTPADPRLSRAALPRTRLAEPFEALRDRSDDYLASHGTRPKVFLACLGRPSDFNARASFAKSLFEAGGIEAVAGLGSTANVAAAFTAFGAKLACLCSSDKVYASEAADVAKALAEAGASHIYLAGKPSGGTNELLAAGLDDFLYQGCDTLSLLHQAYEGLGA
jgi:methylmalonyl-CoA mutase